MFAAPRCVPDRWRSAELAGDGLSLSNSDLHPEQLHSARLARRCGTVSDCALPDCPGLALAGGAPYFRRLVSASGPGALADRAPVRLRGTDVDPFGCCKPEARPCARATLGPAQGLAR